LQQCGIILVLRSNWLPNKILTSRQKILYQF
jgi:hypothetical protein